METALGERIGHAREAQVLLADPARMAGADPSRATLCPGWTARHVLTHAGALPALTAWP